MDKKDGKDFVAYEYKEVSVDKEHVFLYIDAYENFGWKMDDRVGSSSTQGRVNLHFRRDRKIINKMELTRLQRNFDACMEEIRQLEDSKKSSATIVAIVVGIVGTAFMAGSVFAITADSPMILLCIVLSVPGIIGWTLPWFLFKHMVRRRTERIAPLIEAKYDDAYEVCEKGNKLL